MEVDVQARQRVVHGVSVHAGRSGHSPVSQEPVQSFFLFRRVSGKRSGLWALSSVQ